MITRMRRRGSHFPIALLLFLFVSVLSARPATTAPGRGERLAGILQRLAASHAAEGLTPATTIFDSLILSPDGEHVAVRINAADVSFLLPLLEERGFVLLGADPGRHLVEGHIPISELPALPDLAGAGLLGVVPVYRPVRDTGAVTSDGFAFDNITVGSDTPTAITLGSVSTYGASLPWLESLMLALLCLALTGVGISFLAAARERQR